MRRRSLFSMSVIGFNVCMQMGLFGPVMIVASLALLPAKAWTDVLSPVWNRLNRRVVLVHADARWWTRIQSSIQNRVERRRLAEHVLRAGSKPWPKLGLLARAARDGIALALMVYVLVWNLDTLPGSPRRIPDRYSWIATSTGLDQLFNFFAPDPRGDDGWFVIAGTLSDGRRVNAFTGASTVTYERPANVYNTYVDQRRGSFLICLWSPDCSAYLEPFARYLVEEWNRHHSGEETMKAPEITFMHEVVGTARCREPIMQELLWTMNYE